MNVLLTGATGFVGSAVLRDMAARWRITGVGRFSMPPTERAESCDLTDSSSVARLAARVEYPDLIVHAAGDKNVARCESSPESAYAANVESTLNLLRFFPKTRLIYVSSDYVFQGDTGGYRETDAIAPLTAYGRTKACAELAGLLMSPNFVAIRASAIYDSNATFIRFLRTALSGGTAIDCFTDAFYSPTYHRDFTRALQGIAEHRGGCLRTYHVCGERISRFFFAKLFARAFGYDESLVRPASRGAQGPHALFADLSLDCTLSRERLDVHPLSHREALSELASER